MSKYVQPHESGLFDQAMGLEELHAMGDPLARLDEVMEWTVFAAVFERLPKAEPKGLGGRPAFAPALMFKALILQNLSQLSDAPLEFQITDRLSFKRFLGLTDADPSPDEKTFRAFRETLTRHQLIEPLFASFHAALEARGRWARKGQMVDATFVEVPRPARRTWTHAGRKGTASVTTATRTMCRWIAEASAIEGFTVPEASVQDSQALEELIAAGAPVTDGASAARGPRCAQIFAERKVEAKPIARASRNKPRNGRQQRRNRARSKIQVRVEQVFATMRMCMSSAWNRGLGMTRHRAALALTNLVYNLVRFEPIERLGLRTWRTA